jgi:Tol biopolymer transport system component
VVFSSAASNLVSGDTNGTDDTFVYDTVTNTTRRVSISSDGIQGDSDSNSPSISADGRYVAFVSAADTLVSDIASTWNIFVYDTVTNTTRHVSVASDGTPGNDASFYPSISADGRYVAFSSNANNLVSGDTNGYEDVFVYDTVTNTTSRVSISSDGTQGNWNSFSPSISADGSRVAFSSWANNLVSGDTNGYTDIFLYDSGSVNVPQNPWTGTSGDDTYTYTGTADFTGNGLAGNDIIVGGIGNDYILGDTGNDLIIGGLGNDTIGGDDDNDFLYGGRNNDILVGEGGSDFLWGGSGNDVLVGYWLTVGEIDTLIGGRGSDTFGVGVSFAHFGGSGGIVGYTDSGNADYALIKDFSTSDFIELYGNINQYTFGSANLAGSDALDTLIYGNGINGLDL